MNKENIKTWLQRHGKKLQDFTFYINNLTNEINLYVKREKEERIKGETLQCLRSFLDPDRYHITHHGEIVFVFERVDKGGEKE